MAAPVVTGISPKEGPPGTKVTIRGENLGLDQKDLIGLYICDVDCLLAAEWKAPNKIVTRTGISKATGDVIVVTRSGGQGTSTVSFRGYIVKVGPLQESAVWVDESKIVNPNLGSNRPSSPIIKHDDPLGISDEGNTGKFSEDDLQELFSETNSSGNTNQENFNPVWFLLENHHGTKFDDLKDGLKFLKMKTAQQSEGPLAFVKANISTFMDCLDTLEGMHKQLLEDETSQRGSSLTDKLEDILQRSSDCANILFEDVLGRKDRADATRNALSVLQRFKFLFNLPCNIDKNIKKGDYDLVINDYARAKSLFGHTEVQIFKKMYQEVELRISEFREMLYGKLLHLPSTMEEQKKLIRYLVNLEQKGDPGWECLVNQQKWLTNLMYKCKDEHLTVVLNKDRTTESEDKEHCKIDGTSTHQLAVPSPLSTPTRSGMSRHSISVTSQAELFAPTPGSPTLSNVKTPQKVLFVEEMTAILTETFPDLWKLGQAYFSGQLVLKESGEQKLKVDTTKHTQFKIMIMEVITLFSNLLRAAFLPESMENMTNQQRDLYGRWPDAKIDIPGAWLPHCVRHVRSCVMSLSNIDLPSDSVQLLQDLAYDMRAHCMITLLKQALEDNQNLHTRETWVVESSDEYGGTTQLPILFENIINDTVQHLHEVVMKIKPKETEMFNNRTIQKEATALCCQLLQTFANVIEDLAVHGTGMKDRHRPPYHRSRSQSLPMISLQKQSLVQLPTGDAVPPLEKRLIIMLSNCNNTIEHVIPRIIENFERHSYPEMNKVHRSAELIYSNLDTKLFEAYVEEKSNPIVGALEQNMYAGRFDWKNCSKPTGVRSYVKEALIGLISVHAEVFTVSPTFINRVMHKVVHSIADELLRLMQCVTAFSNYGAIQGRLELYALLDATELYRTPDATSSFEEALSCIQDVTIANDRKLLEELLNDFKSKMKFHLLCLKKEPLPGKKGESYA